MNMDLLVPLSAISVMMIVAVTAILARTISQHKLKVEQIKRCHGQGRRSQDWEQIELERLMKEEQGNQLAESGFSGDRSKFSAGGRVSVDRSEFSADRSGFRLTGQSFQQAGQVSVDRSEFSAGRSGFR